MNELGKLKVKLPFFVLERLESDCITFDQNLNSIFNLVYCNLRNKFQNLNVCINGEYDDSKYFKMHKKHYQEYIDSVQREIYAKYQLKEAEYFRSLLYQYSLLPIFERERVLFAQNFKDIETAISHGLCVDIYSNKNLRRIEPYFLKQSEEFTYVFSHCLEKMDYRVFRISNIEKVVLSSEKVIERNKEEIVKYKENFDPFLSFGTEVKVKLTELGKKKYHQIISNRPKLLKEKEDIFTLQCSEKKAQVYFPQFFTEVEILEPASLREWYKTKLKEAIKNYTD